MKKSNNQGPRLRPISFSQLMVPALIDGRKTVTRRPVLVPEYAHIGIAPGELNLVELFEPMRLDGSLTGCTGAEFKRDNPHASVCAEFRGKVGDVLWVKETFAPCTFEDQLVDGRCGKSFLYKATDSDIIESIEDFGGWKSGRFMPLAAARIFLRITDIRVERLQDITDEKAISEGVESLSFQGRPPRYRNYLTKQPLEQAAYSVISNHFHLPGNSFKTLIEKIYGRGTWDKNPFVWVIEFEKITMLQAWEITKDERLKLRAGVSILSNAISAQELSSAEQRYFFEDQSKGGKG